MNDECWHTDLSKQITHVDFGSRKHQVCSDLRRRRAPAQLVEPSELVSGSAGCEPRSENLSECDVITTPPKADQFNDRLVAPQAFRIASHCPTRCVSTIKNQVGNTLRMPDCIADTGGRALRDSEQRHGLLRTRDRCHCFQIIDPAG
jgi:hypothetical protein